MAVDYSKYPTLTCLALVASYHGVDLNVERIVHEYSLDGQDPDTSQLLKIAKDSGLKTKAIKLDWQGLQSLGSAYPVMARMNDGRYVILIGYVESEQQTDGQVAIVDPTRSGKEWIYLGQSEFEDSWSRETLLLKRTYSLLDEDQPFGLRWFVPEILRQRQAFTDIAVAVLFMHGLAMLTPLYFQILIEKVVANRAYSTLHVLSVGLIVALIFDGLLDYLRKYLLLRATSKIDVRIATRTFRHLLSLPIQFYDQIAAGMLTRHMEQTSRVRAFLTGSLFVTLLDTTVLFVFIPVLFLYSVKLAVVVLVFSGLMMLVAGCLLGPYRRRLEWLYQADSKRQALLVEAIHGISTVKALTMEPVQRKNWDNQVAQAVNMHYRVGKITVTVGAVTGVLQKLMIVVVIWLGMLSIFDGEMTVGALVAFNLFARRVSGPLVGLVSLIHEYQNVAISVRKLGQIVNQKAERRSGGLRPAIQGHIEYEKVTFHYALNPAPVLDEVSFVIPAGKLVGIVGRSGSGKTTLTRLLQGLYAVRSGIIRIDGYDLRELDLSHLRSQIGVVLQENFVFRGTVRENIAMARPTARFNQLVPCARVAGADKFIERLPQGYNTMLEENGSNLSGGEKQRLAIARALLADPRILIFDEATSSLDPDSEAIIQRNLRYIARGRTVIIISHRLSSLSKADAIIVLDEGKIADMGSHHELLKRCKVYQHLWNQQRMNHL